MAESHDVGKVRRAPSLELLLREKSRADLGEYYSFWDGPAPAPKTSDELVAALVERMTDEDSVRKRIKFLSKKLIDLLKFLLRDTAYTASREGVLRSRLFSYMSQYEVEAALNALQKRGFVFQLGDRTQEALQSFSVPFDLGEVLSSFLWDEECSLAELFSLSGYLKRFAEADHERLLAALPDAPAALPTAQAVVALCEPSQVAQRLRRLEPELLEVVRVAIADAGGFMTKAAYDRCRGKGPKWDRRRFRRDLEGAFLGTIRHLSLGEFGINHFDDTLVLFDEVVAVFRAGFGADPAHGLDDVRTCGVDLISDISNFLSFVAHNRIRLTLNGQIYRTVTKKLAEQFILSHKAELSGFDAFQYIYDFCLAHKLIERRPDRSLHITVKGRMWEMQALDKKVRVLLDFTFRETLADGDSFHAPRLRDQLLAALGGLEVGRFYDVMAAPLTARNAYLARLEEDHIRDAFQNRYQYAPSAVMRDATGLAQGLLHWQRDRLYLLGLVDIGLRADVPTAMRLTPLGALALGRTLPADLAVAGRPLMVNPDFEVLLFPEEGDTYDLITRLDRFCERQSSDSVYRFKVTALSIEKAVAEGVDVAEILRVLSENARASIPQNVVYSIKEWAGKVRFVSAKRVTVLRGRNREIMDRVVRVLAQLDIAPERLSPTAVVIEENADLGRLEDDLAREGVFLEGGKALAEAPCNGQQHGDEVDEPIGNGDGVDPPALDPVPVDD